MENGDNITRLSKFSGKSIEEIFSIIYDTFDWKSENYESVSGEGSTLKYTQNTRSQLPIICHKYGIKRILDCACGDFNWMKEIISNFEYYKGTDVVKLLIESNRKKYKNPGKIEFDCVNIINRIENDQQYDAVILKDVLVHLTNSDIKKVISNLKKSGIKYAFITNFSDIKENINLKTTGQWRPINLTLEPFNFSNPIEVIKEPLERYTWFDENGNDIKLNDKTLSLWEIQ